MQAKSGATGGSTAASAATTTTNTSISSSTSSKTPPASKISPPGDIRLPKKPPLPQWRKKDKTLEQGVFYKVKDGEYHRVKNDLKKDDRKEKISSINIDMKGAANKINDQDEQESSFQTIQTIYVLLSIVGVVILLIVILCLIPFSGSKKRETAYLQGNISSNSHHQTHAWKASVTSRAATSKTTSSRNRHHSTSSKMLSTTHSFSTSHMKHSLSSTTTWSRREMMVTSSEASKEYDSLMTTTSNREVEETLQTATISSTISVNLEVASEEQSQQEVDGEGDGNEEVSLTTTEESEIAEQTTEMRPHCQSIKYLEANTGVKSLMEISAETSCEKNSPPIASMPQFLTIERAVAFGYPISQVIICNNAIAILNCPAGQLVHVYSAYYGVQSDTATSCVKVSSSTPSLCFSNYTLNRLNAMCEAKQSCSILVTSSNFGEPCLGFNKQMFLQYQCMDESALSMADECQSASTNAPFPPICPPLTSPHTQNQQIWCEPSTMTIECGGAPSQVISILCAFYGKDPNYHCPGAFYSPSEPTYCYSQSSVQKIRAQCNGKRMCTLSGDPDFVFGSGFLNPCPGFAKILFIQWECVSGAVGLHDSQLQLTTHQPWSIMSNRSNEHSQEHFEYCDYSQAEIECPSVSPYVPHYLANSTQTAFGYSIHQQIICNTGRIVLLCPNDLVLHIYGAYYGIQWPTTENSCIQTRRDTELPAMCFFPFTLDKLVTRCESNSSCLVEISRVAFGDPCPTYTKQFFVQYQCIERSELARIHSTCPLSSLDDMSYVCASSDNVDAVAERHYHEKVWCASHEHIMNIKCSDEQPGRSIEILCAFYGLNPRVSSTCNLSNAHNAPVCYFHSSLETVKAACHNRTHCELANIKHAFGGPDPCRGFDKGLYVRWRCV